MSICPCKHTSRIVAWCIEVLICNVFVLEPWFSVLWFLHHLIFSAGMVDLQGFCMHYVLPVLFWGMPVFYTSSYINVSFFQHAAFVYYCFSTSVKSDLFAEKSGDSCFLICLAFFISLSFFYYFFRDLIYSFLLFSHIQLCFSFATFFHFSQPLFLFPLTLSSFPLSLCPSQAERVYPSAHRGSLW